MLKDRKMKICNNEGVNTYFKQKTSDTGCAHSMQKQLVGL